MKMFKLTALLMLGAIASLHAADNTDEWIDLGEQELKSSSAGKEVQIVQPNKPAEQQVTTPVVTVPNEAPAKNTALSEQEDLKKRVELLEAQLKAAQAAQVDLKKAAHVVSAEAGTKRKVFVRVLYDKDRGNYGDERGCIVDGTIEVDTEKTLAEIRALASKANYIHCNGVHDQACVDRIRTALAYSDGFKCSVGWYGREEAQFSDKLSKFKDPANVFFSNY